MTKSSIAYISLDFLATAFSTEIDSRHLNSLRLVWGFSKTHLQLYTTPELQAMSVDTAGIDAHTQNSTELSPMLFIAKFSNACMASTLNENISKEWISQNLCALIGFIVMNARISSKATSLALKILLDISQELILSENFNSDFHIRVLETIAYLEDVYEFTVFPAVENIKKHNQICMSNNLKQIIRLSKPIARLNAEENLIADVRADMESLMLPIPMDLINEIRDIFEIFFSDKITAKQWANSSTWFRESALQSDVELIAKIGCKEFMNKSQIFNATLLANHLKKTVKKAKHGLIPDSIQKFLISVFKDAHIGDDCIMARETIECIREILCLNKDREFILNNLQHLAIKIIQLSKIEVIPSSMARVMVMSELSDQMLKSEILEAWPITWGYILTEEFHVTESNDTNEYGIQELCRLLNA